MKIITIGGGLRMSQTTDSLLLSTKLKIPAPRRDYIVRYDLFEKLSHCAEMGVVFVRGGAGTGKTTLLSTFIREKKLKNVGWLSLDPSNSNPGSFWHYFAAAADAFLGTNGEFPALLRSYYDASNMERLLTLLINRLCAEEDYYIVLDDVHCIADEALMQNLEFFISAMPENLHLLMLSREEPPVYLGTLAVSGRLLFIDGRQMELSPEEGLQFLRRTLKLSVGDEELNRLNRYAEGWIGGLQLAAAAETAGRPVVGMPRAGGGIAADYLTREIFDSLDQAQRKFLIGTGMMAYFDADLCTRIFDGFSCSDFETVLDDLIRKNLFIICVDEAGGVYRYHNILSDYLTRQFSRLPAEEQKGLLTKAADAFEQREEYEEAMRLLCAAGDYPGVMRAARAAKGSVEIWSYLDKIPDDLLFTDAELATQCFMYNLGNLSIERCRNLYEGFQKHYAGTEIMKMMEFAEAFVSRDTTALPRYRMLTPQQIEALRLGPLAKAMIHLENSASQIEHMLYDEAQASTEEALKACAGANTLVDFMAYTQKAQILEETGRLNDSLSCYRSAMEKLTFRLVPSMTGMNFYVGLAGVYMRRMELDKAEEALEKSRRMTEKLHSKVDVIEMTLTYHQAEMEFLHGHPLAGAETVKHMLEQYPNWSILTMGRLIHDLACEGLLRPELGERFVTELQASPEFLQQPFWQLLDARVRFDMGQRKEALLQTEEALVFARSRKNRMRLVEAGVQKIYMLSAEAQTAGTSREISNLLREAIYYAHLDRIRMPFFLHRAVSLPLLNAMVQKPEESGLGAAESEFVKDVIAACDPAAGAKPSGEILSARELEVLQELAQGITNREIAEDLCISQATVKTHVLSIYSKFGVSSRMMAVDEGRKTGLIP